MKKLVTGPFSPRFEASFLEALAAAGGGDPLAPRVILVASNFLGSHLRRRLAGLEGGHLNVNFLTFADLAARLNARNMERDGRSHLSRHAEELMLADLAEALPPASVFHEVRAQEGFHRALRTTFHDLIDGGVTGLPFERGKLGEIARLFREHRKNYLSRFATTADQVLEAGAQGDRFAEVFGTGKLYCYGFYDLTESQARLLSGVGRAAQIAAWLPGQPTEAFRRFGAPVKTLPPASPVAPELFSAAWNYAEAEEVVRRILKELEQENTPLHRFGICLRQTEVYGPIFAEVLTRAGIPFYREGGAPLRETRPGRAAMSLVGLLGKQLTRSDLVTLLSLFPFREGIFPDAGAPADWDAWSRLAGFARGAEHFAARLAAWNRRGARPRDPRAGRFAAAAGEFLKGAASLEATAGSWAAFSDALLRFLLRYMSEDEALGPLFSAVRSLQELEAAGVRAGPERIRRVTLQRLQDEGLPAGTFGKDGLFLGSLERARGIPFRVIAIPGLLERAFPAPPRPDPLLLDAERRQINDRLRSGVSLKESRPEEEKRLFALISSQAERRLILSHPRLDFAQGKELYPSSFVAELEERGARKKAVSGFRWQEEEERPRIDRADWLSGELGRAVVQDGFDPAAGWHPVAASARKWAEERLGRPRWTAYDGRVEPPPAEEEPTFSATQIETYAACPYRYFLARVLALAPLEAPEEVTKIRPADRGLLVHRTLRRLYESLAWRGLLPLAEAQRDAAGRELEEAAAEAFAEAEASLPLGPPPVWEADKAFILADLKAFLESEIREASGFVPADFEIRFGPTPRKNEGKLSTDRPVTVDLGRRKIRLQGAIDRLDLAPDGKRARIIDYKTGSAKNFRDDAFQGGTCVQPAVYLFALPALLPGIDLRECEALFLSTSFQTGFSRSSFSGRALEERKEDFHTVLSAVAEGSRAGLFPPRPGANLENCKACDFKAVCGNGVLRVYERKAGDPAAAQILKLEEIR